MRSIGRVRRERGTSPPGSPLLQCTDNDVGNAIRVRKNLVIPKSYHAPSLGFDPACASLMLFAFAMLPTIRFDG